MIARRAAEDMELDRLQSRAFSYFVHESNPDNGLVIDKSAPGWPASIAATGLALTAYPVGVERGLMSRPEAVRRTLAALRFLCDSPQGPEPQASGDHGLYYHFLHMRTGRRVWNCELSTVDTAFLLAGVLCAAVYFPEAAEIGERAQRLYERVDWRWALNGGATLSHGWRPETGFIPYRWEGYDEALLLYVLALAAPSFGLGPESYAAWARTYRWETRYGLEYLYAGPLFIHQLSHCWIDFCGIRDEAMRAHGFDYFENSRRATVIQRQYAIENPLDFVGYGPRSWGITASDGPGPATLKIDGLQRTFHDYVGRGVPYGPDDGTLAPWAVVASLPFAPELVLEAISYMLRELKLSHEEPYGFKATYNPTFPVGKRSEHGWVSPWHFGINQGPIVIMIENARSGLVWELMRGCGPIAQGLRLAGFTGGWLAEGH